MAIPVLLLFTLPLIASLFFALSGILNLEAWQSLLAHPQVWPALALSIFTGLVSTVLASVFAMIMVAGLYQSSWWKNLSPLTGAMIAVPHLAIAIGLSFLIMPSGLLARLISVLLTGWSTPPDWITSHDPYGRSLIAALVIKETPFLLWLLASILNRDDVRHSFAGQRSAALSLGHGMMSIWLRIFLPQLLPKLIWPLLIVFVYAATVVDMALVIGPTQPPTLAVLVWADINDAHVQNTMRGAAGAWFLTAAVAAVAGGMWGLGILLSKRRGWLISGPVARQVIGPGGPHSVLKKAEARLGRSPVQHVLKAQQRSLGGKLCLIIFAALYLIIIAILLLLSVATLWPFPNLWPEMVTANAWARTAKEPAALITSLVLALLTSAVALAVVIAWFESQAPSRDKFLLVLSATALGVPTLLVSLGQYRAFLEISFTGTAWGLFLAHLMPVTAYMFIVLVGPYRSFDPRWHASASGLLASFPRFLWLVKWPLLKAPLLAASAIGFAVSFGQYVPAQLIAAGRFSTLPMEAVTLTSGTNRPLSAAFSLLLVLAPVAVFMAAAFFSKPRWRVA